MMPMWKTYPILGVLPGLVLLFACSPAPETAGRAETFLESATEETAMQARGRFIHVVFFWFKSGVEAEGAQRVMDDAATLLGSIASVRYLAVGPPAGMPREVVDNSYDVGLVVHFDDEAGHDLYQNAEAHHRFIDRNRELWDRVQVYDILAE
jgi:hypothetical protein